MKKPTMRNIIEDIVYSVVEKQTMEIVQEDPTDADDHFVVLIGSGKDYNWRDRKNPDTCLRYRSELIQEITEKVLKAIKESQDSTSTECINNKAIDGENNV